MRAGFGWILTGMRQMKQFSLRWEHVDLERGVLTLPDTKAGGVQYVRLNEEAKILLQHFIPGNKSIWVFPSENPATHADPHTSTGAGISPRLRKVGWRECPGTACGILSRVGSQCQDRPKGRLPRS